MAGGSMAEGIANILCVYEHGNIILESGSSTPTFLVWEFDVCMDCRLQNKDDETHSDLAGQGSVLIDKTVFFQLKDDKVS
jgi:hypothetical protein